MNNEHILFHITTQNWRLYRMNEIFNSQRTKTAEKKDLKMKNSHLFSVPFKILGRRAGRINFFFFFHVYFSSAFFALTLFRNYMLPFGVLSE